MYNNSKSLIKFTWANINDCDILEILPLSGKLGKGFLSLVLGTNTLQSITGCHHKIKMTDVMVSVG